MLYVHTSNHLEQLKRKYEGLVKTPLKDVFQTETVVVQNAGMARWLSMEMAQSVGISANTEYLFPAEFMWRLLRLVSSDIPEQSQCAPDTLRFHIYEELVNNSDDYPEIHHYIYKNSNKSDDLHPSSQFNAIGSWELSCQTARLLDQYLFYRGDWISQWENDKNSSSETDSNHWQARIWKRCVKDKDLLHWLKLQQQFSQNLSSFDINLLGERISFFSMSALSPGYIDLLEQIAHKTDIHIFIINPCADVYWGDIQSPKTVSKLDHIEQEYSEVGNPLLASLGKQGRDFIDKLISIQNYDSNSEEIFNKEFYDDENQTLLGRIQQDIYELKQPEIIENYNEKDNSVQLHSCHTPMREVEVIYDQILHHLDNDEFIAPSDIVVMMPDIEKYAAYIESVFSSHITSTNQQKLPFSIADRDPQNIFKITQAVNKLFCLPDSKFDVESVFELLEYDDIRTHFGLNQEQLNYCRNLALATNIRWGISSKSRKNNNLPETEEHTWKYALDRMLLGYTLADNDAKCEQLYKSNRDLDLLPYNEIEGSEAIVLAKFSQFTDLIFSINEWQKQSLSVNDWLTKTNKLIRQFSPENSDQERLLKTIADIQANSNLAEFNEEIPFDVFLKILQQGLSELTANEKFLGYGITFCALVPMRSVPFKIVILMGMNDGEFPRQDTRPSFDLMSNNVRRGDRSRREEDRYLFLESILAARKKLVISYIGQSIKDNTESAPSIVVSELLETIEINSGLKQENWIIKHPLQAFSSRYFQKYKNTSNQELFSYASQYLALENAEESKNISQNFITNPLNPLDDSYKRISLKDLIEFYKSPSRTFLKTRFGIQTYDENSELKIREPFEIESFKDSEVRNLILANCDNDSSSIEIARAKGLLPYGQIGDASFSKEKHIIETFEEQLPDSIQYPNEQFTLEINDFVLDITIDQLTDNGRVVNKVSKPYANDYISLWLNHLCLNVHSDIEPNQQVNYISTNRTLFYSPETSFQLEAVNDAKQQLTSLIEHYWKGLHFPLLFFPKSSFALYSKNGKVKFKGYG